MRSFDFLRKAAAFLPVFAALLLAACVVVEEGPGPGPRPPFPGGPGGPGICTREYAPVCGERRGERETFGNACVARSEGFRVISDGECRRGGDPRPPVACTREYAPVCGERRGERQTFGNACVARSEGFRVIDSGECRRGGGGGGNIGRPPQQQSCTRQYEPVCARRGRDFRTFGNSCEANAANFQLVKRGPC